MDKRLSPKDQRLYRLCDEALYYLWDPIGVAGAPSARDEYDTYLPQVFALVKADDREGLVSYLLRIPQDRMGIRAPVDRVQRTSDFLLDARSWIAKLPDDAP